jgi:histidine ammonia-lyase
VRSIRGYLVGAEGVEYLAYQAPVSFRSMPRVLGWFRRTASVVEELAATALRTSSNNPAFVGPDQAPPIGAVLSNGGYHSPYASPALDALTRSYADIAQMLCALTNQVIEMPGGLLSLEPESEVSTLYHVTTGWAEEARAAATPSLISLGNGGQTDTGTLDLMAWRKSDEAAQAVEAGCTVLAISAAHAAARKNLTASGELAAFQAEILEAFPLGTKPIDFAPRLEAVRRQLFGLDRELATI